MPGRKQQEGIMEVNTEKPDGRYKIGTVWVDSGQVIIVDPCYLKEWGGTEYDENVKTGEFSYAGACAVTTGQAEEGERAGQMEHGAVASSTGWGDGCYPVFAEIKGARVMSLTISFDHWDEDEDEDEERDEDED
jgi:hypothetical protein